jgi:O-antigen/teichoic acid export membrane protein
LSGIKKLAGQTLWYGVPTIASRFLGYALNILLFWLYKPASTAYIALVYASIPFLNILFTYGLETSYFRFVQNSNPKKLYNTLFSSLIVSTLFFSILLFIFSNEVAVLADMKEHPEYIRWMVWVLIFDTLAVLPFSKLRQEGRPKKFAFIKVTGIVLFVLLFVFFLGICPKLLEQYPNTSWLSWYNPSIDIGYYIIANVLASGITLLLLWKELKVFKFEIDFSLWKKVLNYSYPLIIVGLGGMINEMLSRLIYVQVVQLPREVELERLGIFSANYKLAVLITIFIQIFRMGAEPFFFNKSKDKDAPETYARVMKYFVIVCSVLWLAIVLNLNIIKHIGYGSNVALYEKGIHIIPILAMGGVFLGIYYNLTVWYKLTNKTLMGAWITIFGAIITIVLNIWWIPIFDYTGSAWATLCCYGFMMLISYYLGQKYYPIPYPTFKIFIYLIAAIGIFLLNTLIENQIQNSAINFIISLAFLVLYLLFLFKMEKEEFKSLILSFRV